MKFLISSILIILFSTTVSEAQLRSDLNQRNDDFTAAYTHQGNASAPGSWMNLLNMSMSHSYSMTFNNFGGQMNNLNAYTNHMLFDISDRLNAQVDVSVLHSPFGNSFMNNNQLGTKIILDQARLDYRLSPNSSISVQFSQRPAYYGYNPFGQSSFHSPYNRMRPGF
ncbi:MAG: hypothetical protein EA360_08825 [Balneolaceae bacterium]|nr:MAG: hypothetical protein EA360_08825 [Balneolaceae bacterium]